MTDVLDMEDDTDRSRPFRDLDDGAKETAKHNVGEHWYEQEREDTKTLAEDSLREVGITLDMVGQEVAFDVSFCQGSGMSITGNWQLSDFDECEPILDVATDYPQFDREQVHVCINADHGHYVHSNTMRIQLGYQGETICMDLTLIDVNDDLEYDDFVQLVETPLEEMGERILAALREICDDIHRKLESFVLDDCDGYIDEWMDGMGYEFDAFGNIVHEDERGDGSEGSAHRR